jgi:hypothetical protein
VIKRQFSKIRIFPQQHGAKFFLKVPAIRVDFVDEAFEIRMFRPMAFRRVEVGTEIKSALDEVLVKGVDKFTENCVELIFCNGVAGAFCLDSVPFSVQRDLFFVAPFR